MMRKERSKASESGVAMAEMAIVFAALGVVTAAMLNSFFTDEDGELTLRNPRTDPVYVAGLEVPNPLYGFKVQFDRIDQFFALPIP